MLTLAAELSTASELPAALKVNADSFVPFEGHDDRHLAAEDFDLSGGTASERLGVIAVRDARDDDLRAAAPYGGSGSGGGGNAKTALQADPKARLHIKTSVKVLQLWLNSLDVAGPLVYTVQPVAAAFGVAPVAGVIDEARSGIALLVAHHQGLAVARRSCGSPWLAAQFRSPKPSFSTLARLTLSSARSRAREARWRPMSPPSSPRVTTATLNY